jgi:hypothetical protein
MKLQFEFDRCDQPHFEVDVAIDCRAQRYKFELVLRKELLARKLVNRSTLELMLTAPDGSAGVVFSGRHRRGEWHRAGA